MQLTFLEITSDFFRSHYAMGFKNKQKKSLHRHLNTTAGSNEQDLEAVVHISFASCCSVTGVSSENTFIGPTVCKLGSDTVFIINSDKIFVIFPIKKSARPSEFFFCESRRSDTGFSISMEHFVCGA